MSANAARQRKGTAEAVPSVNPRSTAEMKLGGLVARKNGARNPFFGEGPSRLDVMI